MIRVRIRIVRVGNMRIRYLRGRGHCSVRIGDRTEETGGLLRIVRVVEGNLRVRERGRDSQDEGHKRDRSFRVQLQIADFLLERVRVRARVENRWDVVLSLDRKLRSHLRDLWRFPVVCHNRAIEAIG